MRLRVLIAGLTLALTFTAARSQTAALPAAAIGDADPALWVVKDEDTTIYLFGTIHALKPGLVWFDDAVRAAFDKSDTLVLEMIEPEPEAAKPVVQRLALNPGGPTVTSQLPPDKREAYAAAMRGAGLPPTALDAYDPWFPTVYLSVATLPKYGYDPSQGADKVIVRAAKAAGKPMVGLETLEQQLSLFDDLPKEVQIRSLVTALDMLDQTGPMFDAMVDRWAAGDPDGLNAVMNAGMRDVPEVAKVMLADRNARWAEWVAKRLAEPGTVFVAVGAGHLAGGDSVQANLHKRQVTATRVAY